jgi:hypothetical protein
MPHYDVAHTREQGQDMIVVPMGADFGRLPDGQQQSIMAELQVWAGSAGLRGRVAIVWPGGFRAPRPWHPFFRTLPIQAVLAGINKRLSW